MLFINKKNIISLLAILSLSTPSFAESYKDWALMKIDNYVMYRKDDSTKKIMSLVMYCNKPIENLKAIHFVFMPEYKEAEFLPNKNVIFRSGKEDKIHMPETITLKNTDFKEFVIIIDQNNNIKSDYIAKDFELFKFLIKEKTFNLTYTTINNYQASVNFSTENFQTGIKNAVNNCNN